MSEILKARRESLSVNRFPVPITFVLRHILESGESCYFGAQIQSSGLVSMRCRFRPLSPLTSILYYPISESFEAAVRSVVGDNDTTTLFFQVAAVHPKFFASLKVSDDVTSACHIGQWCSAFGCSNDWRGLIFRRKLTSVEKRVVAKSSSAVFNQDVLTTSANECSQSLTCRRASWSRLKNSQQKK